MQPFPPLILQPSISQTDVPKSFFRRYTYCKILLFCKGDVKEYMDAVPGEKWLGFDPFPGIVPTCVKPHQNNCKIRNYAKRIEND